MIISIIRIIQNIVFIFIVICTMFLRMCPPALFRYFLSESGAFSNLGTFFSNLGTFLSGWVQSSVMAPDYDKKIHKFKKKVPKFKKAHESDKKYLKKAGGHISRNVVQITIKMWTIVQIIQIIQNPYLRFI